MSFFFKKTLFFRVDIKDTESLYGIIKHGLLKHILDIKPMANKVKTIHIVIYS